MNNEPKNQWINPAAEAYEKYIVAAWMSEWAEALVKISRVEPGKQVLDTACGTGIVSRKIISHCGTNCKIVGLDLSEEMIQAAEYYANLEGMISIEWRQGDIIRMPFGDDEFDIVFCQQGLQFSPDPLLALQEMRRVLKPGGQLALSVWRSLDRQPYFLALMKGIESFCGKETADFFHAPFILHDREKLHALIEKSGFRNISFRLEIKVSRYPTIQEFLTGYLAATSISGKITALPDKDRAKMIEDIIQFLQPYTDDFGLAAPMESYLITAEK